jgi:hypothetical protein
MLAALKFVWILTIIAMYAIGMPIGSAWPCGAADRKSAFQNPDKTHQIGSYGIETVRVRTGRSPRSVPLTWLDLPGRQCPI